MAVAVASFYKCMDPYVLLAKIIELILTVSWKEGFDETNFSTCIDSCVSYTYASVYAAADNSTSVTCICSDDPADDNYTDLSTKFSCNRPCPSDSTYTCGSRDYAYAFSTYTITVTERVTQSSQATLVGSIVGGVLGFLAVVGVSLYIAQRLGYITLPAIQVKKRPFENIMHRGGQYRQMAEDSELLFDGYMRPPAAASVGRVKKHKLPFFHVPSASFVASAPGTEQAANAEE
ncbi:hypothetical protein HDU83_002680 [Entophlyctis luteolus]|nr:hypothetical protein HDU83_002680 [Entophlyctis luteolus]